MKELVINYNGVSIIVLYNILFYKSNTNYVGMSKCKKVINYHASIGQANSWDS